MAVFEHDDLIGVHDGAHTLGDDQHGRILDLNGQRLAQRRIGGEVERGEAVVEDVQVGLAGQRAGDGQALTLPAGEVRAALRHTGVQSERQFLDEAGLGHLKRVPHLLLGGVGIAVPQVVCDRAGEQPGLLRHVGDVLTQLVLGHVLDVAAVQEHAAVGRVEQAQHQPGDRRLAGTGRADDGGGLSAAAGERQVVQRVLLRIREAEREVVEAGDLRVRVVGGTGLGHLLQCHHRTGCGVRLRHDLPAVVGLSDPGLRGLAGGGLSRLSVADARLLLDDRAHAADADDRTRHHQGHELRHHDVEEDQDRILDQRGDVADLHRVHADAVAARPDDQHDRDVHQEEREAVESGEQVVDADRVVRVVGERLVEALDFMAVAAERADDAHAGDVLAQHHVHAVDVALQLLEDARRLPNDQRRQDHDDHDDGEHDPAHLHVEHERQRDAHHAHDRHRQQDLQTIISACWMMLTSLRVRVIIEPVPNSLKSPSEKASEES